MERFRRLQQMLHGNRPPPPDVDMTLAALEQMRDLSATQALTNMILSAEQAASWQVGFHTSPNLQNQTVLAAGEELFKAYQGAWVAMYTNALEEAEATANANTQTSGGSQATSSAASAGVHNPAFFFPGLGMPPTAVQNATPPTPEMDSDPRTSGADQSSASTTTQKKEKEALPNLTDKGDITTGFVEGPTGTGGSGTRSKKANTQGMTESDLTASRSEDDDLSDTSDTEKVIYTGRTCRDEQAERGPIDNIQDSNGLLDEDGGVLIDDGLEKAVQHKISPQSILFQAESNTDPDALDGPGSSSDSNTGETAVTISAGQTNQDAIDHLPKAALSTESEQDLSTQVGDATPEDSSDVPGLPPILVTDTTTSTGVPATASNAQFEQLQEKRTTRQCLLNTSANDPKSKPAVNFTCAEESPQPNADNPPAELRDHVAESFPELDNGGFSIEGSTEVEGYTGSHEDDHDSFAAISPRQDQLRIETTVDEALLAVNPIWQGVINPPQFVLDRQIVDIDLFVALRNDPAAEVRIRIDQPTQLRILDGSIRLPTRFADKYLTEPPLPVDLQITFGEHQMPQSFSLSTMGDIMYQVELFAGVAFTLDKFGSASDRPPFHPQSMTAAPSSVQDAAGALMGGNLEAMNGLMHHDGDTQDLDEHRRGHADQRRTIDENDDAVAEALLSTPAPFSAVSPTFSTHSPAGLQQEGQSPSIADGDDQHSDHDAPATDDEILESPRGIAKPEPRVHGVATGYYSMTSIPMSEEVVDLSRVPAAVLEDHEAEQPATPINGRLEEQNISSESRTDRVASIGAGKVNDRDSALVAGPDTMSQTTQTEKMQFVGPYRKPGKSTTNTMVSGPMIESTERIIDWTSSEGLKMDVPGFPSARQRLWDHMKVNSEIFNLQKEATTRLELSKYKLREGLSDIKMFFWAKEDKFELTFRVNAGNKSTSEIADDFKTLVKNYGSHFITNPPVPLKISVSYDDCKAELKYHPATLDILLTGVIALMEHGRKVFVEGMKLHEADLEELEKLSPGFYEEICKHGDGMPKYTRK